MKLYILFDTEEAGTTYTTEDGAWDGSAYALVFHGAFSTLEKAQAASSQTKDEDDPWEFVPGVAYPDRRIPAHWEYGMMWRIFEVEADAYVAPGLLVTT